MRTRSPDEAVFRRIEAVGLLPVIVVEDPAQAGPLARALVDSGLHTAEVTFRTPHALEAISVLAGHPELLVGAGTVRSAEQVRQARDAGAQFVVSPGYSTPVVEACRLEDVPVVPGVSSATDIHRATEGGLDVLKFFPAEASGGAAAIAALSSPFPDVRFIPTGGVSPTNLGDYLGVSSVCGVGGSWMVPREVMRVGDWHQVTELCRLSVEQIGVLRDAREVGAAGTQPCADTGPEP